MTNKKELARATLIAKVSDPDYELPADAQILTSSPEGHAETLAMLLEAAETPEEQELIRDVGGRPTLDAAGAPSVPWRGRAPRALDQRFRATAAAQGRTFSEALRDAAEEYINRHGHAPAG